MTSEENIAIRNAVSANWWLLSLQGLAAVLFGMYALANEGKTVTAIMLFLGCYWMVSGLLSIVDAIRGKAVRSRIWLMLGGTLSVLAGGFAVSHPIIAEIVTASVMGTLLGLSAIINGVSQMLAGREVQKQAGLGSSKGAFFWGLLNLVCGIIIVVSPIASFAGFMVFLAYWLVFAGVMLIVASFRVRSYSKQPA